jgi:hypothetical protein
MAAAAPGAPNRALWRADFAIWRANRANAAAARQWRAAAEAARKREACVVSLEEVNAFDAQRNRFAERTAPGRESRQRPS